ncbi:hypothetical protein EYF80_034073 [Liparis tanakae]|uniref:Uncharacterized protein n=1 Tax=Liparis tanakae TaxID=230148 RepID=A0A4Z2GPV5_9TELE|nr:hypothetical protein EYF80_034073 [Liparis tanakae]
MGSSASVAVTWATVVPVGGWGMRDAGHIRFVLELRGIVIDVLHLDDELRLGFLGFIGPPVDGLGPEDVEGLFLPVELLQSPDLPGILVDLKRVSGPFTRQDVLDGKLTSVVATVQMSGPLGQLLGFQTLSASRIARHGARNQRKDRDHGQNTRHAHSHRPLLRDPHGEWTEDGGFTGPVQPAASFSGAVIHGPGSGVSHLVKMRFTRPCLVFHWGDDIIPKA